MSDDEDTSEPRVKPSGRAGSMSAREKLYGEFVRAGDRLIIGGKEPHEWTDDETAAIQIVSDIAGFYLFRPHASAVAALKKARDALRGGRSRTDVRAHCVDEIDDWGKKWQLSEWQASAEARALLLLQLANRLWEWDPGFDWLKSDPEPLIRQLDAYSPKRSPGKKVATRILAELVVMGGYGVLGFDQRGDEHEEEAIEHVRKVLDKARRKVGWTDPE